MSRLNRRRFTLAVGVLALLFLPIGLPQSIGEPPSGEPYLWQLGAFAVGVGVPFVAVAANAPLLQAWFVSTGHKDAENPYFLYAASNLGSLIALLGYPFILEPLFGLRALAKLWTAGFVLLLFALVACGLAAGRWRNHARTADAPAQPDTSPDTKPTWSQRLGWIGLALVPSAMLTAFTTHIATDVASAPLIWVIPLVALPAHVRAGLPRSRRDTSPTVLLVLHLIGGDLCPCWCLRRTVTMAGS